MIWQKLRKLCNSHIVAIPIEEDQLLTIEVHPAEVRPAMSPELRKAFEESWHRNEPGYRYLAEH